MSDLHEFKLFWPDTQPTEVIATGTFDKWSSSLRLSKGPQGFSGSVHVPWAQKVLYKFIVDGRWTALGSELTEHDHRGNQNNVYHSPPPPPAPEPTAEAPASEIISTIAATDGTHSVAEYITSGVGIALKSLVGVDPINRDPIPLPTPTVEKLLETSGEEPVTAAKVAATVPTQVTPVNDATNNTTSAISVPTTAHTSEVSTHIPVAPRKVSATIVPSSATAAPAQGTSNCDEALTADSKSPASIETPNAPATLPANGHATSEPEAVTLAEAPTMSPAPIETPSAPAALSTNSHATTEHEPVTLAEAPTMPTASVANGNDIPSPDAKEADVSVEAPAAPATNDNDTLTLEAKEDDTAVESASVPAAPVTNGHRASTPEPKKTEAPSVPSTPVKAVPSAPSTPVKAAASAPSTPAKASSSHQQFPSDSPTPSTKSRFSTMTSTRKKRSSIFGRVRGLFEKSPKKPASP